MARELSSEISEAVEYFSRIRLTEIRFFVTTKSKSDTVEHLYFNYSPGSSAYLSPLEAGKTALRELDLTLPPHSPFYHFADFQEAKFKMFFSLSVFGDKPWELILSQYTLIGRFASIEYTLSQASEDDIAVDRPISQGNQRTSRETYDMGWKLIATRDEDLILKHSSGFYTSHRIRCNENF